MIKNLGQIAGLWVGNTSPQNNLLIWFDTGNNIHKTYDYSTGTWIPVSMNPIVSKTYSELQSLAALNSISQGTFYRIIDFGYLALAITSTKIQYTDNNNNVIIDDLISTKTYCITSNNLLIEDKGGVWDVNTNTLKFSFEDTDIENDSSATTADDYVLGTKLRNGIKKLSKYKLSSLISSVTGNAISWNKGFFLNFLVNLQSYYDVNGGVVRYTTYTAAINTINQSLTTLQQNINDLNIWNKAMPSPFNPPTTPTDMAANDTLKTLFQKIQAWINKFKNAKGIVLSSDYAVDNSGVPAIGDTVEQAIGKIQYEAQGLPEDWVPSSTTSQDPSASAGDTFPQAIAKIQRWLKMFWHISPNRFWSVQTYDNNNPIFDFTQDFEFKVNKSNNSYACVEGGKIEVIYSDEFSIPFRENQTITINSIGSKFQYNISSIEKHTTIDTGTVIANFYAAYFDEPSVTDVFPSLSVNQQFLVNDVFSIFASSIKTKVKASVLEVVDIYRYDTEEVGASAETYNITKNTSENVIFIKKNGDLTTNYVNFHISSLREGQIIEMIFLNNTIDLNISLLNSNIPLLTSSEGGALGTPQVGPIGVSSFLIRNKSTKFIAVLGSSIGYSQYNFILVRMN